MASREQNERRFDAWVDLSHGGRRYWLDIPGRDRGRARYVKEVDGLERTLRFWQEIHDDQGNLVAFHEKFPEDTGHHDLIGPSEEDVT
jgi:hypothetical protein